MRGLTPTTHPHFPLVHYSIYRYDDAILLLIFPEQISVTPIKAICHILLKTASTKECQLQVRCLLRVSDLLYSNYVSFFTITYCWNEIIQKGMNREQSKRYKKYPTQMNIFNPVLLIKSQENLIQFVTGLLLREYFKPSSQFSTSVCSADFILQVSEQSAIFHWLPN